MVQLENTNRITKTPQTEEVVKIDDGEEEESFGRSDADHG